MKIIAIPELLRNPDVLSLASLCRELGASRYSRFEGTDSTAYGFDKRGEKAISRSEWDTILSLRAMGLKLLNATLHSPEVSRSVLEEEVPEGWPNREITEEIEVDTEIVQEEVWDEELLDYVVVDKEVPIYEFQTRVRVFSEYAPSYDQGVDSCILRYSGPPIGKNFEVCDDEQLQRWLDKFGGEYQTLEEFEGWREVSIIE